MVDGKWATVRMRRDLCPAFLAHERRASRFARLTCGPNRALPSLGLFSNKAHFSLFLDVALDMTPASLSNKQAIFLFHD